MKKFENESVDGYEIKENLKPRQFKVYVILRKAGYSKSKALDITLFGCK